MLIWLITTAIVTIENSSEGIRTVSKSSSTFKLMGLND